MGGIRKVCYQAEKAVKLPFGLMPRTSKACRT